MQALRHALCHQFAGMDPIRPTRIKVGAASAAITGANATASALIWKMRSGEGQSLCGLSARLIWAKPGVGSVSLNEEMAVET